jgi:hypothetical protein
MFHVGRFRLFHAGRRALRRERVFRGTVVEIFTHPENDLDGECYVHVRYDMDLMMNSKAYEILLI